MGLSGYSLVGICTEVSLFTVKIKSLPQRENPQRLVLNFIRRWIENNRVRWDVETWQVLVPGGVSLEEVASLRKRWLLQPSHVVKGQCTRWWEEVCERGTLLR